MRLPRVCFTVRRLALAMAVLAVWLTATRWLAGWADVRQSEAYVHAETPGAADEAALAELAASPAVLRLALAETIRQPGPASEPGAMDDAVAELRGRLQVAREVGEGGELLVIRLRCDGTSAGQWAARRMVNEVGRACCASSEPGRFQLLSPCWLLVKGPPIDGPWQIGMMSLTGIALSSFTLVVPWPKMDFASFRTAPGTTPEARAMRMPRARLTVRKMMLAVAVAALVLWAVPRAASLIRLSRRHQERVVALRRAAEQLSALSKDPTARFRDDARRDLARRQADWANAVAPKYERASRYPWLPVAPDPPEPE